MNFCDAVVKPHDLSVCRLKAFCRYVGLSPLDNTIETLPVGSIMPHHEGADPSRLNHLDRRMGVYVFQLGDCVVYVGRCTKARKGWNLQERIRQRFREGDTGNNLYKNWRLRHCDDFAAYKAMLVRCSLWTISFPPGEDTQQIARLEHLLIGLLGPKYCDVPDPSRTGRFHNAVST